MDNADQLLEILSNAAQVITADWQKHVAIVMAVVAAVVVGLIVHRMVFALPFALPGDQVP